MVCNSAENHNLNQLRTTVPWYIFAHRPVDSLGQIDPIDQGWFYYDIKKAQLGIVISPVTRGPLY